MNFNNYSDNPIVKYCYNHIKNISSDSINILSLEDCLPDIQRLPHAKKALDNGMWSYIGDSLRLYYSTIYNNYLYIDGDSYIKDIDNILKYNNCTQLLYCNNSNIDITTGPFLHTSGECDFARYYLEKYKGIKGVITDVGMYKRFPYRIHRQDGTLMSGDMALIKPELFHFRTSLFTKFCELYKNENIITYTFHHGDAMWDLNSGAVGISNRAFLYPIKNNRIIPEGELFELWKEQICYALGRTVKFEEI